MGKKTERIGELEEELAAYKFLVRTLGDSLDIVSLEDPLTMKNAPATLALFTGAIKVRDAVVGAQPRGASARKAAPARSSRGAGAWDTFDDEVDAQIDRFEEAGLTKPGRGGGGGGVAMVPSAAPAQTEASEPSDAEVSGVLENLARELGVDPQDMTGSPFDALTACYNQVLAIKNRGSDAQAPSTNKALTKGDSLAQAMEHAHAQNNDLRERSAAAGALVSRIAEALQVPVYNDEGEQLFERIRVYEDWRHNLKRRIRELSTVTTEGAIAVNTAVVAELEHHLAAIMSKREWSDWQKARPREVALRRANGLTPLVPPYPLTVNVEDVALLDHSAAWADTNLGVPSAIPPKYMKISNILKDMRASPAASEEFCRVVNLQVLPILAREIAARQVPGPTEPDAPDAA